MRKIVVAAHILACVAGATCLQAAHAEQAGQYSLGTGLFYSTGSYGGSQPTDILYIPVIGKYQGEDWTLKLTVPYIQITGPGNVLNGVGATGVPATPSTQSGLGDVVAAATRRVYADNAGFMVDLTGKVKFGTADANKGLGTGKNDYSLESGLSKTTGKRTVFGSIGYRVYGSPVAYKLKNVFYGSLGVDFKVSQETNAGVMLNARQKALANGFPHEEALFFVNRKIDRNWKMQGYMLKGFTNGSPDVGAGATVTYIF